MSVTFSSLKLKPNTEVKKITINEKEIEVLQYLPAEDKNSLLELTIQEADRGTVVNTFALDCLFHLYLVMEYTNITFTDKQRENMLALYDLLETNGVIEAVVAAIPVAEYNELRDSLNDMVAKYAVYRNSFKAALEQLQMFVPQQAGEMAETIQSMDMEKLGNVLSIADAAGIKFVKPEK